MTDEYSELIGKKAYKDHDGLFGGLVGEVQRSEFKRITPLVLVLADGTKIGVFPKDLVFIEEDD